MRMMVYPDTHPVIRDKAIPMVTHAGRSKCPPQSEWDKAAVDRDEAQRVLALICAWCLDAGIRDPQLNAPPFRVERPGKVLAIQSLIASARTESSANEKP